MSGFFLLFTLVFTERHRLLRFPLLYPMIFCLPLLLIILQWIPPNDIMCINESQVFPYGWDTFFRHTPWAIVFLLYTYSFAFLSLYLLYRYRKKVESTLKKKQAGIILSLGIISILVTILLTIFSEWQKYNLPFLGDIVYVLWATGIIYAITKYKLFTLTPAAAAAELIATMSDSLFLVDKEGIIRSVSPSTLSLLDGNKDIVLNQPFERFFNTNHLYREQIAAHLYKEQMQNIDTWCRTVNGTEIPVLFSSSPKYDDNGEIQGAVCVVRDISELRRLEKEVIAIEGREQLRIGHDLHDGLGQHLTGIALGCKALEQKSVEGTEIKKDDIKDITTMVNQATEMVCRLSKGLSPIEMQHSGLYQGLHELAEATKEIFSVTCRIDGDAPVEYTNEVFIMHIYRIAQEAITNAVKHGKATDIQLKLYQHNGKICLQIIDNGTGIPEAAVRSQGMGLRIMRYRARIIGASLDISRGRQAGTIITCTIPHYELAENVS